MYRDLAECLVCSGALPALATVIASVVCICGLASACVSGCVDVKGWRCPGLRCVIPGTGKWKTDGWETRGLGEALAKAGEARPRLS